MEETSIRITGGANGDATATASRKTSQQSLRKSPGTTYEWHLHKNRDEEVRQMLTPPEMSHELRVNNSHQFLKAFTLRDPRVWRCGEMIPENNEVWRAHPRSHKWYMRIRQDNPNVKIRWCVMWPFPSVAGKSEFTCNTGKHSSVHLKYNVSDNWSIAWQMNYTCDRENPLKR